MKNFIKGLSISILVLGGSFTATYTYLDVSNKEETTVTQTTLSTSENTQTTVSTSEQTENTSSYNDDLDVTYMPQSTKKMKLMNGTINSIEGEQWKMLPNNQGSMILVAFSNNVYNNEICELHVLGDSWTLVLYNTGQIISQGDVINA